MATSCGTMLRRLLPWICASSRRSTSIFFIPGPRSHGRSDLLWFKVTRHPTAEWLARQITEAFPWDDAPQYLIRDRDRIYGTIVTRRLRSMGIRDKPIAPASPWQNGFAERLIGSIRRECVDHLIVLSEAHLGQILRAYARYYNDIRTHWSLAKTHRFLRPFSRPEVCIQMPSSAGCITTTSESRFSVYTGRDVFRGTRALPTRKSLG